MSDVILPEGSEIFTAFAHACNKRCVFIAGLSGVGKSLYLQQMAIMASEAGRVVHLLQWDVTREAFQAAKTMRKYPERDGVTHAAIRKAVGLWARAGVMKWHNKYSSQEHILIGELPLVGNRLVELVQIIDDEVEPLLSSDNTHFLVPVPSVKLRQHILSRRSTSISEPQHRREAYDAPPAIVNLNWQQVRDMAVALGLCTPSDSDSEYDPEIYSRGYAHLLQHRHFDCLPVDEKFPITGSVYELGVVKTELLASKAEVAEIFEHIDYTYTPQQLELATARWFDM